MGEALYDAAIGDASLGIACRIYAPVGGHEDLLAYLVRRLLENGANTSFVNRLADDEAPVAALVADPVAALAKARPKRHPRIPQPPELFGRERRNSLGLALDNRQTLDALMHAMNDALASSVHAAPLVSGKAAGGTARADHRSRQSRAPGGPCRRSERSAGRRSARCSKRRGASLGCIRRRSAWENSRARGRSLRAARARSSWRSSCARRGASFPTRSRSCARRWISCAITRRARAPISPRPSSFRAPPASATR